MVDTAQAGARLVLTGTGTSAKLVFTEDDGTITRFAVEGSGKQRAWVPESVTEPGTAGATTYLTGYGSKAVTRDVLDHEKVHVKQWNRYGLTFAILYGDADRNPCRNHWERQASLAKGNYRC